MAETEAQYLEIGDALVQQIDALTTLPSRARIVDIGCGYGRLAHALIRSPQFLGRYFGFDILPRHIAWCEKELAPASAGRCRFRHVDVHNGRYNPGGEVPPDRVVFDIPSGTADLVVLTSVFTHMHAHELKHYLSEIRRLLAPEGLAYVTFFLLNDAMRRAEAEGRTHYPLPHTLTPFCRHMNADDPLHVIAYEEPWVREQLSAANLKVVEPIRFGRWAGHDGALDFQDTVLLSIAPQEPGLR